MTRKYLRRKKSIYLKNIGCTSDFFSSKLARCLSTFTIFVYNIDCATALAYITGKQPGFMKLDFWKYEGTGNDFILIDGRTAAPELPGDVIRALCNRHNGIGADGLMILSNEYGYDFRMTYFNSDGGEVSMCGNGGRCISLFAHHLGIGGPVKHFIGKDGPHRAHIISDEGESAVVELEMIDVHSFEHSDKAFYINTGVPHYVEFCDDVDSVDVAGRGSSIRYSEKYRDSGGTNANFVQVLGPGKIKVRTYERGVEGETLACGTGAVSAAIATHLYTQGDINAFTVNVPGGTLEVSFFNDADGHFSNIKLTGLARRVFLGSINPYDLI